MLLKAHSRAVHGPAADLPHLADSLQIEAIRQVCGRARASGHGHPGHRAVDPPAVLVEDAGDPVA